MTKRANRVAPMYRLDSKPYSEMVRRAGELADKALRPYGEPTLSLAELRMVLDKQLHGLSLSELIIKEREIGC